MLKDLEIEKHILADIKYQLTLAEGSIIGGYNKAANYRLHRAHEYCQNLENRLADAIEETS